MKSALQSESSRSINPNLKKQVRAQRTKEEFVLGILKGDRVILSQAITLIESARPDHQALAQQVIERCLPYTGRSIRIGITGSPGVGKSTFIEAFGKYCLQQRRKVAVLAIDPSSQLSRGSILGDKTRMAALSNFENTFIRPSAAGNALGGVAHKTRETILLCEAAGFDTIIVETVGVGQSEIAVRSMVDCFLLLLLPGAGDELQGIKRGIVEMADILAVNKADSERLALAKRAQQEYRNALHLFPAKVSGWSPSVVTCSAATGEGISEIWQLVEAYWDFTSKNGYFEQNRQAQTLHWLHETIEAQLRLRFYQHKAVKAQLKKVEKAVLEAKITITKAADELLILANEPQ